MGRSDLSMDWCEDAAPPPEFMGVSEIKCKICKLALLLAKKMPGLLFGGRAEVSLGGSDAATHRTSFRRQREGAGGSFTAGAFAVNFSHGKADIRSK
ncbi:hypothetical protein ACH79_41110 [Bradyrhizobium sp. CCBAU 051011]|nr:hypothetical protein ACH79_41110 [Bradyrhizobium sp. CCBAU 051011]